MEWARSENVRKKDNRHQKHDLDHRQQELNSVTDSRPTTSRLLTSIGVSSAHGSVGSDEKKPDRKVKFNTQEKLSFVNAWTVQLDNAIGNLIVEEATPLVLASKPGFRELIDKAIEFGAEVGSNVYAHAGKKRLRQEIIPRVIRDQANTSVMQDFDCKLAKFGGTLVADGKDDVNKDHLLNYITVCPDGYRFELSRDVSGIRRKAEWVADDLLNELGQLEAALKVKLESVVDRMAAAEAEQLNRADAEQAQGYMAALERGELTNYVQIVTDTPSVNAKAWTLIESKVPHLLANPCNFHCLNLYFKHLLEGDKTTRSEPVPPVAACVELEVWTKQLEQWFTNKESPRAALQEACLAIFPGTGPRRLRKYSDTRAAVAYRVWHRTLRLKSCLRQAAASSDYVKWEKSLTDADEKARATSVREILADNTRFELLADVVQALTPVYRFLRLVDGYTPAVGKVYAKALAIDEHFSRLKDARADSWCSELHNFWIRDWGYMHVDMHSLGYCVDPEFHSQLDSMPSAVWTEFLRCAERMLKAAPKELGYTIQQLTDEYSQYQNLSGGFTSAVLALAETKPGHLWWQQWGKGTPALQFVATRALAQTVAASCSEQAWSEYDIVHCRRRNRLEKSYASNLTRGHNQARLIRRLSSLRHQQKFIQWSSSDDDEEEAFFSD